mmetsp:Transcript_12684/g.39982  ORF Transcript_12684/g.39982 Transcript_12684/m.39982 type:complete len:168 (+) Transcript_12684:93-596(+)
MPSMRVVASSLLSLAVSALRLNGTGREVAHARLGDSPLGADQDSRMQKAYFAGRDNTIPQLLADDTTDYMWYKANYSQDKGNPLEELSFIHNATQPSDAQDRADEMREVLAAKQFRAALDAALKDSEAFYRHQLPTDGDNDLEEYSYMPAPPVNATGTANATKRTNR